MLSTEDLYEVAIESIELHLVRFLTDEEKHLVKLAFHLGLFEQLDRKGEVNGTEWAKPFRTS